MTKVKIKRGGSGHKYHRINKDGEVACNRSEREPEDSWKTWPLEKAQVWKDPCQNTKCFGEGQGDHDNSHLKAAIAENE